MERETFVGIDVGTTKVVALIGEVGRDGGLTIIGKGIVPASGLRKGIVVNIDQTVHSISAAVEKAERHAGYKIERAFVGVGGQHVEGLNSPGQVAVAGPRREVTQEDVNRSIEVARAVSIPSTRDVLHVIPRGYTVDGQEGVMNPLGMSAVRLEVSTHIVTASATAVQNLTKCVTAADVKIDELVAAGLASAEAVLSPNERELGVAVADIGAGTIDLTLYADGSPFHTAVLPVGGSNVTNDVAIGLKTSLHVAEALKVDHGTCDLAGVDPDEVISVTVLGDEAGRTVEPPRGLPDHRGPDARDVRDDPDRDPRRRAGDAAGRARPDRRGRPACRGRGPRPRRSRHAGPGGRAVGRRRARRRPARARLVDRDRAPPVGRPPRRRRRADDVRLGAGRRAPGPHPGRVPQRLPVAAVAAEARPAWRRGRSPSTPVRATVSPT